MISAEQVKRALIDRQRAYLRAFRMTEAAGEAVLADLATFCRANESCVVPGDRDLTYVLEGRREVYLRIMAHLNLNEEQLIERFTRPAQGAISHERHTDPDTDADT